MPRYKLRTLLIVLAIGPPVIAVIYLYPAVLIIAAAAVAFIAINGFAEIGLTTYLDQQMKKQEERRRKRVESEQVKKAG